MTDPVVMSGSSMNTFLRCGHQWYLANVVALRMPPNVRQVLGIAAHSAIEHNMAQKVVSRTDVTAEEMVDVFSDQFDSLVSDVESTAESPGEAKDDGVKLVRLHRRDVSPRIQPVWVEHAGQLTINDIPYAWTVDLADERGRIRDTKTTRYTPSSIDKYMLQMTGYALGFRQETGRDETGLVVDVLSRTKVPRYTPLIGGTVSNRAVSAFAATLDSVYNSITNGDFPPNGLTNGACGWCGYAEICKYRQR